MQAFHILSERNAGRVVNKVIPGIPLFLPFVGSKEPFIDLGDKEFYLPLLFARVEGNRLLSVMDSDLTFALFAAINNLDGDSFPSDGFVWKDFKGRGLDHENALIYWTVDGLKYFYHQGFRNLILGQKCHNNFQGIVLAALPLDGGELRANLLDGSMLSVSMIGGVVTVLSVSNVGGAIIVNDW